MERRDPIGFPLQERPKVMAAQPKTIPQGLAKHAQGPVRPAATVWKYPSEDEALMRRLGSAALSLWPSLTPDIQEKLLAEASLVWDREYNISNLSAKLLAFVKRRR
jgi:hypothetical protein